MSNSTHSSNNDTGILIAASLIVVLSAGLAASFWPYVLDAARTESNRLTQSGKQAQGSEAQLDFQLAQMLNPNNQDAALAVASRLIAAGQAEQALPVLDRSTDGGIGKTAAANTLYIKVYLETGNTGQAVTEAKELLRQSTRQDQLYVAALAFAVGDQDQLKVLMPRITSSEAAGRLAAAQSDQLALARELHAVGLLHTSQHLLVKLPMSFERNHLLAGIEYTWGGSENLASAEALAMGATALNPVDRPARQLLLNIFRAEGKTDSAAQQQKLLDQLKTGKP